jgi:hypothetical protein
MFLKFWKYSQAIRMEMGSKYVNNVLAECFQCIWRAHYQVESVLCKQRGILKKRNATQFQ